MQCITDFTLVRHGQTADNVAGILQGHRDTPLDELGIMQAERAAARLAGEKFDFIFSSDLKRAFQTAEIISKAVGIPVCGTGELREWNLGELEGRESKLLWQEFPEIMDCFNYESGDIQVPGGESHGAFERRIAAFLDKTAMEHSGKRILLVTHAGPMRAVFKHIVGPVSERSMLPTGSNCSCSRFINRDGLWQLLCWNDVSHLNTVRESLTF